MTPAEIGEKTVVNQVTTQSYQALSAGRFRLPPFSLTINGEAVRSEGAILIVRAANAPGSTESAGATQYKVDIAPEGAAFLSLRASKTSIYAGESVALTLSFFVADNYPYELSFTALDKQLQTILKKIRPVNSWEESLNINELKPIPVLVRNKKFREFRLYQSVFFPLSNQPLRLPAVSLQLTRPRPKIGPPLAQAETVLFTSKPVVVAVRALPAHPLRGRVPVGVFRLEENLDRQRVNAGQSVRYTLTFAGEGNIATLPAPAVLNERTDMDIFPPEERHLLTHAGNQVVGRKSFTYFIVPHQNGLVPMTDRFLWIYFNPQTVRYDTLRPRLALQVGGRKLMTVNNASAVAGINNATEDVASAASVGKSLYTGIEAMDSTRQSISFSTLIRSIANVLIVIMLLGMLFVFLKR
ncbi:BatD family protein [Spirosoma koreense]